jgi:hypothetical protein
MKITLAAVLLMVVANVCSGNVVRFVKSQDQTAQNLPMEFIVEKSEIKFDSLRVWGTIKNTGYTGYKFVKVIFTVKDASGNFITRDSTYSDPAEIGVGQKGFIEDHGIDLDGKTPATVEWLITGNE